MNDEIKEILDILIFNKENILNRICRIEDFISREQIIKLLDYITNLQQINKNLTNSLNKKVEEKFKLQEENDKLKEQCKQWKENHKAVCIQRDNILNNTVKDIEEMNYLINLKTKNANEINRLNNILNDFNHRFAKIEGICNEMIKDRMYMNEYAIKRYAEEIKEIVFYYIIELKGDSSNE